MPFKSARPRSACYVLAGPARAAQRGRDTTWADLAASYEALSEPVKTLLEGRYAYHVHRDYYLGDEERSRRYDGRGGYRLQHAVRGPAGGRGHHEQWGLAPAHITASDVSAAYETGLG